MKIQSLDNYLASHREGSVQMVKIDVEGAELEVLEGARGLIQCQRPALLIEASDLTLAAFEHSVLELFETLTGLGYVAYRLTCGQLVRLNSDVPCPVKREDWICIHESRLGDYGLLSGLVRS